MRIPLACTLTRDDASERVEAWRRFLGTSVQAAERPRGTQLRLHLRLHLRPPSGVVLEAVALAQREKACCGFFDFSIELESDSCWLVVAVPTEAADVLTELTGLLPREDGP